MTEIANRLYPHIVLFCSMLVTVTSLYNLTASLVYQRRGVRLSTLLGAALGLYVAIATIIVMVKVTP